MSTSNEELVQNCRGGDPLAWEVLIDRYKRLVYSIPHRAGLDGDRSAEVFQRVFEKLVIHLDRIEQPDRIGAWLATTARRETWQFNRGEGSTQLTFAAGDIDQELNQFPCEKFLPEEVLLRLEERRGVRRAVAALDERCRCLLELLFYRSVPISYAELATTLDLAEGSIGPSRARCLQKLRGLLDNMGLYCMFGVESALSFRLVADGLGQL